MKGEQRTDVMIKTTLKTMMFLGMAVTGLAFAAGSCE